jgi:hypothetical protein
MLEGAPVQRKMAIVARLLRGEPLELVARETNVSIVRPTEWRERALSICTQAAFEPHQRPTAKSRRKKALSGLSQLCPLPIFRYLRTGHKKNECHIFGKTNPIRAAGGQASARGHQRQPPGCDLDTIPAADCALPERSACAFT